MKTQEVLKEGLKKREKANESLKLFLRLMKECTNDKNGKSQAHLMLNKIILEETLYKILDVLFIKDTSSFTPEETKALNEVLALTDEITQKLKLFINEYPEVFKTTETN